MTHLRRHHYLLLAALLVSVELLGPISFAQRSDALTSAPESLASALDNGSPLATLYDAIERENYSVDWAKAEQATRDEVLVTTVPLVQIPGLITVTERQGEVETAQLSIFTKDGDPAPGWPMCHRQPSTDEPFTLYVEYSDMNTYVERGDVVGFCPGGAGNGSDVGLLLVSLGQVELTSRLAFDEKGQLVVLKAGAPAGLSNLGELLTVSEDTRLQELTKRIRDIYGDDAERFLQHIPGSQGGTGPEIP